MSAHFYDQDIKSGLKNKRLLGQWLEQRVHFYLEDINKVKFSYIFCSDEALLKMNQEFLNHDTFTDIITFDLSESEHEINGEIYVSVDRVADNARRFGVSYDNELHRVIFHGMLHLCGFGDKKPAEKAEMRSAEDACLAAYFAA